MLFPLESFAEKNVRWKISVDSLHAGELKSFFGSSREIKLKFLPVRDGEKSLRSIGQGEI